jgi:hypothetical protein
MRLLKEEQLQAAVLTPVYRAVEGLRIRIAAERCKLPLQFRVVGNFAQVFAYLIDDCLGRADGRYQDSPASVAKSP